MDGVEDEQGDLIPCREGDIWKPIINVDSGKILNWTQGVTAEVHYKVCDQCSWELLDESGNVIKSVKDEYVPDTLCPKEEGYGDYIIMDVDANGMIANWKFELAGLDLEAAGLRRRRGGTNLASWAKRPFPSWPEGGVGVP